MLNTNISAFYNGFAGWILASVHLQRGMAPEAEFESRRPLASLTSTPPFMLMAHGVLARALRSQGRLEEGAAVAREGLALLAKLGDTGFSEVPFRVAAAEVLHAAGELAQGRRELEVALEQIALRADRIPDPALKERYLTGRPENRRAYELARAWFSDVDASDAST